MYLGLRKIAMYGSFVDSVRIRPDLNIECLVLSTYTWPSLSARNNEVLIILLFLLIIPSISCLVTIREKNKCNLYFFQHLLSLAQLIAGNYIHIQRLTDIREYYTMGFIRFTIFFSVYQPNTHNSHKINIQAPKLPTSTYIMKCYYICKP